MEARPGRGGQFHIHVVVVQVDFVEARMGLFAIMGEMRSVRFPADVGERHVPCHRHEKDVSHIGAACAAEVGMRKTNQGIGLVVVARAEVPLPRTSVDEVVGAHLDHAERQHGRRVRMPHVGCSDERIDIVCRQHLPCTREERHHERQETKRRQGEMIVTEHDATVFCVI